MLDGHGKPRTVLLQYKIVTKVYILRPTTQKFNTCVWAAVLLFIHLFSISKRDFLIYKKIIFDIKNKFNFIFNINNK